MARLNYRKRDQLLLGAREEETLAWAEFDDRAVLHNTINQRLTGQPISY